MKVAVVLLSILGAVNGFAPRHLPALRPAARVLKSQEAEEVTKELDYTPLDVEVSEFDEWLIKMGLMDYSLILGVKNLRASNTVLALEMRNSVDQHTQPLVCNVGDQVQLMYLGFIDFLQDWTWKKVGARPRACGV